MNESGVSLNNSPLIDVQGVAKYFSVRQGLINRTVATVRAVERVSFDIHRGETLGLVGESGSGKTTLGRVLLRAIEPTNGKVVFYTKTEEPVEITSLTRRQLREFRRHMQMVFQDPYSSLNPRMTVRDTIAEPLIVNGVTQRSEVDERVRDIARRCHLNLDYLQRYPHSFSGGQRQRVALARALVLQPEFVVCDEPVSALDVSIQAEILNLLQELQEELGLTYLFIAHDLSVVEHMSNRVAVMYLGQLVELAPTQELYREPRHPYTEALMAAIPLADPGQVFQPVAMPGEIPNPANPPTGCHLHPRCRYATDICFRVTPVYREVTPEHYVACHLADELHLIGVSELQ
ncbi:MAG: ABC transporter ATP-binding protein [Anaerolineaceae bacterium]